MQLLSTCNLIKYIKIMGINKDLRRLDQIIGNNIYELRTSNFLDRKRFADKLKKHCNFDLGIHKFEISRNQLGCYEKGIHRMPVSYLVVIAQVFNKTLEWFIKDHNYIDLSEMGTNNPSNKKYAENYLDITKENNVNKQDKPHLTFIDNLHIEIKKHELENV